MLLPLTKLFTAAMLAAASLAAGAQTLLTQIPLGSFRGDYATVDVAVNSATNRIYVPIEFVDFSGYSTDYNYARVLVIDGATNQVVHTLADFPSGSYYWAIAIDPVRNLTYVEMGDAYPGDLFANPSQCTVSAIDGRTEKTINTISLPVYDCGNMAVDPVTGNVYVRAGFDVDVIESQASGVVDSITLYRFNEAVTGQVGGGLAVSPYLNRLYFTSYPGFPSPESLVFFDTLNEQATQQVSLSADIDDIGNPVVNPATGHLFGTTKQGSLVSVFNSGGSLLATVAPPASSAREDSILGMDVDPKTNLAFVFAETYLPNDTPEYVLSEIDGVSNTVRSSTALNLPLAFVVGGRVAVNPDTSKVYVPYNNSTTIFPGGQFYLNVYSEQ